MTPKHEAMSKTKVRRLLFDLNTGAVLGLNSGGGALEELSPEAYLIALFNDPDAATKYGCLDEYFDSIPPRKPTTVDLTKVNLYNTRLDELRAARALGAPDAALERLMDVLDDTVGYVSVGVPPGPPDAPGPPG